MRNTINLLPAAYRRQQIIRRRVLQWSAVISGVLMVGWAWHCYELREYRKLSQELESLQREHRPTQTMLRQLVEMRQKLVDLQRQEGTARELEYQRNALALLGAISQASHKADGRLRVTKLVLTDFQAVEGTPSAGAPGGAGGLALTGLSLDNPSVAELLDSLQASGIFSDVVLSALTEHEDNSVSLRDYEVRCAF